MKTFLCIILLLGSTTCSGEKKTSSQKNEPSATAQKKPVQDPNYSAPWNTAFHLRETENGEVLGIGSVFSNDSLLYVYDLAAGAVVTLDLTLSVLSTTPLSSIGRNSYAGDDFVVLDTCFIFLNTVDRKLEYFDIASGTHLRSVPLPKDLLADAPKRSQRILSRLFLSDGQLLVGNEHRLVPFNTVLGKKGTSKTVQAETNARFLLYKKSGTVVQQNARLKDASTGRKMALPKTHHEILGKRFFRRGSDLYTVCAGKDSVTISKVH